MHYMLNACFCFTVAVGVERKSFLLWERVLLVCFWAQTGWLSWELKFSERVYLHLSLSVPLLFHLESRIFLIFSLLSSY